MDEHGRATCAKSLMSTHDAKCHDVVAGGGGGGALCREYHRLTRVECLDGETGRQGLCRSQPLCSSCPRACSGYVRASLVWCYLQSKLFKYTCYRARRSTHRRAELHQSDSGASPLAAKICVAGVHARNRPPGKSPFLHDHLIGPRPFLPHGRHMACIIAACS